jgi:hypothetical protein
MKHSFKWNKQQILMDFHIRDKTSFEKNVKVFKKSQKKELIDFIIEQKHRYCGCKELYFILILVPVEHRYKLKNIKIKDEITVNHFYEMLNMERSYSEIWVCTNWSKLEESISGRFCIDMSKGYENQIIEIVKGDAPRVIEKIEYYKKDKSENQIEYYIYSRNRWGMRYKELVNQNKSELIDDGNREICRAVESKREVIDQFYTFLEKIGILSLSLEFRFQNGKLEFIDWDTENDKKVIRYLLGE